jgi:hypothetical protein
MESELVEPDDMRTSAAAMGFFDSASRTRIVAGRDPFSD